METTIYTYVCPECGLEWESKDPGEFACPECGDLDIDRINEEIIFE